MRLHGQRSGEDGERLLDLKFVAISVTLSYDDLEFHLSSCVDMSVDVIVELLRKTHATCRPPERRSEKQTSCLAMWRSPRSIADPWDPPEGFIIFGSISSASRPIAYIANYCKGTWSLC